MITDIYKLKNGQDVHIRFADVKEAPLAVAYMQKLGAFQKMSDATVVTDEQMTIFLKNGYGEAIFARHNGEIKAFAFFCQHASSFLGRTVLYIDAFYVDEDMRGQGLGKILIQYLAQICVERNYGRMEWACLDWNTQAWDFYTNLGSKPLDILTLHRLDEETIRSLA